MTFTRRAVTTSLVTKITERFFSLTGRFCLYCVVRRPTTMAEGCTHVKHVQLAEDKSFLNPRSWTCSECGFTDSVWACLLCPHVACGRDNYGHALMHFQKTKHPLAVEVNKRYVHCYLCNDYVLTDNSAGDIALIQSMLSQVASQHYESTTRSGRVIGPPRPSLMRRESRIDAVLDRDADRRFTALCHWRYLQLSRAFNTWREYVATSKKAGHVTLAPPTTLPSKRKRLLTPGMTGLRNLGNTCYMNSVLQSLGHLIYFRESFRQLLSGDPAPGRKRQFDRQTTYECYEDLQRRPVGLTRQPRLCRQSVVGGLKGGGPCLVKQPERLKYESDPLPCLCKDVHALMRVMWSGKWAMVTPHAVLNAVWRLIPSFSGYSQQDAQEFLCELLDVLQSELNEWPHHVIQLQPLGVAITHEILPSLFQGQLSSKVTYESCGHVSSVQEPFWDLSLDFPQKYQMDTRKQRTKLSCSLDELLEHFTSTERLEETSFHCSSCCHGNQSASKRLLISEVPDVLRLHLKRFRWSGRARHKLLTHVQFPCQLNLNPYMAPPPPNTVIFRKSGMEYDLSSVIIHHGAGFSSGHYTSYCWNSEAGSWVHFNDVRVSRVSLDEVLQTQAYILFYTRRSGLCSNSDGLSEPPNKRIKLE